MSETNKNQEQDTVKEPIEEDQNDNDFPDAVEIVDLLGDNFEMPSITTESEESAPSAEPEPIEDPETGESYFDDESQNFERPSEDDSIQTGEKDAKGRLFDPQQHATDSNGNPKYNKKGYFVFLRKDKRGKVDTDTPRKAEYYETGLMYFDGMTDTLAALLGDHWKPTNEDQRKSMGRSVGKYLESENAPALSPAQELLLKSATYSAPRVAHTDTIDNMKLIIGKSIMGVKNFWATLTGKKKAKKSKPEPVEQAEELKNENLVDHPNS